MSFKEIVEAAIAKNGEALGELNNALAMCTLLALPDRERSLLEKTATTQLQFGRILLLLQKEGELRDEAGRTITDEIIAAANEASENVKVAIGDFRATLVKE
ncbi:MULTISPECIES: hypothetical protein [Aeromonas]|uniref:Uncharacterized protein n=1 Tax=Aeromonas caviae TaxID=648 RepID=A0AAJ5ZAZ6_AERCA|nr:hypothetical protein [Aeromonas caviae]RWT77740.1 hypothetical protein DN604_07155 [Aeromonas caviae]WFG00285.1 hypothetical protein P5S46_21220 [Aeromonas caviae]WVM48129.1 hypothetical protein V0242_24625 [Aeromonas hydrophila]